VEDIQRELNANLEKLEQQAVVAQRYRDIENEQARKQQWLWLLKSRDARDDQARAARLIEEAQLALDARIADLRHCEAELESLRATHYSAGDAVHAAQGSLYEASGVVSQIEAEIRYVIDSRNRLELQAAQLAAQKKERESQRGTAVSEEQQARARLEEMQLGLEEFAARRAAAG
jgi:chromosome segregation protein